MAFANPIYLPGTDSKKQIDENTSRRVEFKVVSLVIQQ
jgi:hypothetical protein